MALHDLVLREPAAIAEGTDMDRVCGARERSPSVDWLVCRAIEPAMGSAEVTAGGVKEFRRLNDLKLTPSARHLWSFARSCERFAPSR